MRKPIILFLMLCCFAQCCCRSEKEQKALKDEQEKVELNFDLNNEVMKTVKEGIKNLTFLNLCFAKPEFLELIKNDASFRNAWKEKVTNIPFRQKDELSKENQDYEFFNEVFLKDKTSNYAEQVAFLKQYCPKAVGNNYLAKSDYAMIAANYGKTGRLAEIYATIYDLLIVDATNFLNEINQNQESISGFRRWLTFIEKIGIRNYNGESLEMMKRKRDYIVSSLEKIDNPLAKEAIEVIKSAVIRPID